MDGAHRHTAPDIVIDLFEHPERYSFFRAVTILLDHFDELVEEEAMREQSTDNLLFRVDPSLGFPSSDVVEVRQGMDPQFDRTSMMVTFLGLNGVSSPLPLHMVEAANWSKNEEGVLQAFHDFFSNRLIWLFYLAWRKYRYHERFRAGASDQFSEWMFCLIGIGGEKTRASADLPWSKMLTYLGIVAAQTRASNTISGVISHAFNLSKVTIRQFELRTVDIPANQQVSLGGQNSRLSHNFSIGSKIQDRMSKFTVILHDLTFERFCEFLPAGSEHGRLKELIEFLLKDQMAYDIELQVRPKEVPKFQLGAENYSNLGWTTFIRSGAADKPAALNSVVLVGQL